MSESMRTDGFGNAVSLGQVLDNQKNHLACEACATAVKKHNVGEFWFYVDVQPCALNVLEQDFQAAVADGYKPFLATFAEDAQKPFVPVYIADL